MQKEQFKQKEEELKRLDELHVEQIQLLEKEVRANRVKPGRKKEN